MTPTTHVSPLNPANRLGLNYRHEATRLPWHGPIDDAHIHISGLEAARKFFEVADLFGIGRVWSQTQLEEVDTLRGEFGDRIEFVAIPNYMARDRAETFGSDWLRRIEAFHARGSRIAKFWAAPRGRDFHESFHLEHPTRREAMKLAHSLGMIFMTHVGDPDTWFATHYKDANKYGTKPSHYEPLRRLLDQYRDVPWMAAHMGGDPEHLEHLQDLLDAHPNLHLDISATKWMVRELSKRPDEFRDFCRRNNGRLLFGTDLVVAPADAALGGPEQFDLYASRYWAMRTLIETSYDGPSPIVDPDLPLVDSSLPATSTAHLRGAKIDPATLATLYRGAARQLLARGKPGM
ncbi:MAG: amidohydrolase family protein [Planctomycetes bacterium]|nr:amidohydrolase family protein [Planctomycetota bacterium]